MGSYPVYVSKSLPSLRVCKWTNGCKQCINCVDKLELGVFQSFFSLLRSHVLRQMVQAGMKLKQNCRYGEFSRRSQTLLILSCIIQQCLRRKIRSCDRIARLQYFRDILPFYLSVIYQLFRSRPQLHNSTAISTATSFDVFDRTVCMTSKGIRCICTS